VVELVDTPS